MMRKPFATAVMVIVLLLTIAVYWPGLHGEFEFDDFENIVQVQELHVSQANFAAFKNAALAGNSGLLLRPLAYLSFALNHYFFGLDPFYFKFVNLLIHLANGCLLFLLCRILLMEIVMAPSLRLPIAAITTAVWLLHPLNVTSVLYVVQRMTSLASLFMLAGVLCYAVARRRMLRGRGGRALIFCGTCGFGLLALATKEIGVLLPVYMLALETTIFRWRVAIPADRKFIRVFFIVTVALPVMAGGLYLLSRPEWFIEGYRARDFTPVERLMTEARVLWFYLSLILYPDIARMGLYHDDIALSHGLLTPLTTLPAVLGLIALVMLAIRSVRRAPLLALAVFWFFAGHALESTIIPLEIAHEHRNYLAAWGPLLALTWALTLLARAATPARWRFAPLGLFLLLVVNNSFARAWDWGSYVDHAVAEAIDHPQSARSVHALGWAYFRAYLGTHDASLLAQAQEAWQRTAGLDHLDILPYYTLVCTSYEIGREPNLAWFAAIRRQFADGVPSIINVEYLKNLLFCKQIPAAEMKGIFEAYARNPRNSPGILSQILKLRAIWENEQGDPAAAGEYLRKAISLNPDDALLHIGLANWHAQMGDKESANAELARVRELDPLGRYNGKIRVEYLLHALGQGIDDSGK